MLCFFLLSLCSLAQSPTGDTYLLKAGKIFDAEKGVFLTNQAIYVQGGTIKGVGANLSVPKGTPEFNLPQATITPGLIDAHTHLLTVQRLDDNLATDALLHSSEYRVLRAAGFARSYLEAGFTTIRDLGNSGQYLDVEVAKAINRGFIPGPRMLTSGPIISAMDGQFYQLPFKDQERITKMEYRVVNGAQDAALAVKEHANNGVSVIKVVVFGERMGLTAEEMKAIVQTAHSHRLKVTAHATSDNDINGALEAGVDGIEHGYYMADSILEKMAKKGVYLVPTDPSTHNIIEVEEARHIQKHDTAQIRSMLAPLSDRLKRAQQKGVLIVAGSDAYFDVKSTRGNAAKQTLIAYFEEGLSPATILQTATWNAAKALDLGNQHGVLRTGAKADLVIFNGDLEKDFPKALFEVRWVIKDGKLVKQ